MAEPIRAVFDHLDRWRHFPAYQLERRADIFFATYLADVIGEFTGVEVDGRVIPEFPLRLGTLFGTNSNASARVDYLAVARDKSRAFLIELKTDMASRQTMQDERMGRARQVGMRELLEGLIKVVQATSAQAQPKYGHMLFELRALGLLDIPDELPDHLFPRRKVGVTALLNQVRVRLGDGQLPLSVIYIQPLDDGGDEVISFARFAEHLERHDDPVSGRFRESLLRWTGVAGAASPS